MLLAQRIIKVEYADHSTKTFIFDEQPNLGENSTISNFLYAQGKKWLSWTEIERKYKEV